LVACFGLVIARRHPARLLQAQKRPLDDIALFVQVPVEVAGPTAFVPFLNALLPLIPALRDHHLEAAPPEMATTGRIAVTFVAQHTARTLARTTPARARNPHGIQGSQYLGVIAALTARNHRRQRAAFSVAERVQLAGQPAPAAPECLLDLAFLGGGPPFLAPAAWG
jgi:hypothetical protein